MIYPQQYQFYSELTLFTTKKYTNKSQNASLIQYMKHDLTAKYFKLSMQ